MSTTTTLDVRPLTGVIGAEIHGVDLGADLDDATIDAIKATLWEHQVVFFRDQDLSHDAHKAFGRRFGELAIHTGVSGIDGHPEVVAIHTDETSKFVAGEWWHTDLPCNEIPPMGSILYLHTVPPTGGDTLFASMYAAYDALSSHMKDYLAPLTATQDGNKVYKALFPELDREYPVSSHPVVRTHPVTGRKALYVNEEYTTKIDGLARGESDAILGYLFKHMMDPTFQVRFHWEPRSIAFWDNRCTQHMAVWDYFPHVRSGYRVTVAGEAVR